MPAGVDMREWIRLVRSSNSIIHKSKEHATVATVYAAAVLTDINSIQQLPIPSGALTLVCCDTEVLVVTLGLLGGVLGLYVYVTRGSHASYCNRIYLASRY